MTQLEAPNWWKVPMVWMLVALPLTAVVAGIATVVIAFNNQDGLVTSDVQKLGFTTTQIKERETKAASLGLSARLTVGGPSLVLSIAGHGLPENLTLRLVHPTLMGKDQFLQFVRFGQEEGMYKATSAQAFEGKRVLVLEPSDGAWRLVGAWPAAMQTGEIALVAGNSNPPPHQ